MRLLRTLFRWLRIWDELTHGRLGVRTTHRALADELLRTPRPKDPDV
jgi:hypothetical protein